MKKEEVILAGFGGQGILFAGKLLTWAGLLEEKKVTCIPSYGAEMRGGTAHCHVILSEEEISSPVVENPTILIVLNSQSLDKFEKKLAVKGKLILNSSLIERKIKRRDIEVYPVPGNKLAEKLGSSLFTNMVILGATSFYTGIVKLESLIASLPHILGEKKELVVPNRNALKEGYEYARDSG